VDAEQAARSRVGQWVAAAAVGHPLGWAVRTDGIDAVAERLGIAIADGARGELRWRMAGVAEAAAEPSLPFFIEWAPGSDHPGTGSGRIAELQLSGDPGRLADWLGPHDLPVSIHRGSPAVERVVLEGGRVVP
jgi:hypothetical protein